MPVRGNTPDLRQMLLELGVPPYIATASIPFMFFLPGSIDPDSSSVIEIIRGLQRGLRKLGYKRVIESGVMDKETAAALDHLMPQPRGTWKQTTWAQLYGEVISALKNPDRRIASGTMMHWGQTGLHGFFTIDDAQYGYGPIPGKMVGLPPGPLGLGDTAYSGGVTLNFGFGVRNKSNIVPIPKKSGATFNAFRNLQRQINRVLHSQGAGRISEDGIIGEGTKQGLVKAQKIIGVSPAAEWMSTFLIARNAVVIANVLADKANAMVVPANANRGASSTVASESESASKALTMAEADRKATRDKIFGQAMKVAPFLALGGVAAYFVAKKRPKRKGKR